MDNKLYVVEYVDRSGERRQGRMRLEAGENPREVAHEMFGDPNAHPGTGWSACSADGCTQHPIKSCVYGDLHCPRHPCKD